MTAASLAARRPRVVSTGTIAAALLALFAIDNVVLLAFLGLPAPLAGVVAIAAAGGIFLLGRKVLRSMPEVPVSAIGISLAVAAVLLLLGGEGRLFFANADWQIRDAVLNDLAGQPWPFAYQAGGEALILRAPLGMYLLPSLAGPGASADFALLASNAVRLGLGLALAWPLFGSARARGIAVGVFILFSGWDSLGTALFWAAGVTTNWDHLEWWNFAFQYSSHITQLFWVPQHALAGWMCAVTFLLWRTGKAPLGLFAATIPLVALWSPLAVIGAVPFALFAAVVTLAKRTLRGADVWLAAAALVTSLGALAYLQLDAAKLGGGLIAAHPVVYALCILLEVIPFIYPLLRERNSTDQDRPVLWLILGFLLIIPLFQVGMSTDLQMRASIMPLALLALAFAQWTVKLIENYPARRTALAYALVAILLSAATPAAELRRALTHPASPAPLCSLVDVWHRQSGMIVPLASYFSRVEALPSILADIPVRVRAGATTRCWARPWPGAETRDEPSNDTARH